MQPAFQVLDPTPILSVFHSTGRARFEDVWRKVEMVEGWTGVSGRERRWALSAAPSATSD
jgi:hypothetical protein